MDTSNLNAHCLAKPCSTCPWLVVNHGRQNPEGVDKARAVNPEIHNWYSIKNLRRLWNGIRTGEGMICHATDSRAEEYGGKNAEPGHERVCIGALVLVKQHLDLLGELKGFKAYRLATDNHRMTLPGMRRWVERAMFPPHLPAPDMSAEVGLPFGQPLPVQKEEVAIA